MRIVYMGTPDFAVPALKKIKELGHEVPLVYTQPDRPKGRGKKLMPSPVKEAALELGLPVRQPEKLRNEEEITFLREAAPDLILVAAYGQILPKRILELPAFGCVNLHASLLPKYRGAAPVEAAILAGEREAGVTIMQMAEGLDTGDMLRKGSLPIMDTDTAGSLTEKLAGLSADMLPSFLEDLPAGRITPEVQKEEESSYAGKITREMGRLDFSETAETLSRRIRALNPHATAFTTLSGRSLKIHFAKAADPLEVIRYTGAFQESCGRIAPRPGQVLQATKKGIAVMTGEGVLLITELQPEGKKAMPAAAYLNGYPVSAGEAFS